MLQQEGIHAVVVRHLRNVPSKVTEEFENSVIDQSQSYNANRYDSVWLCQLSVLLLIETFYSPNIAR